MTKISVIMPVYNTDEKCLKGAIESVLAQTLSDFEFLIVNDGSKNNALDVINEYALKDERIKVINQTNQGLSCARNNALDIARGDYIAFLDSDDFYAPNFLELMLYAQSITDADIVGCDFKKIYNSHDTLKNISNITPHVYENALDVLLHKKNFIHFNVWNKIYRRKLFNNVLFIPHIYYEDWVFNVCVFCYANKFVWIKDKLYGYRILPNSIMRSDFNAKKLNDYVSGIKIVAKFYQCNYPELWQNVKETRISRTVKMLMNATLKSKNKELEKITKETLRILYKQKLISFSGSSFINKIKLFRFLKGK